MVKRFLNGRCGLGNTFWCGVFLSGIIFGWIYTAVNFAMLKSSSGEDFQQLEMVFSLLTLFHAVFLTCIFRAVFISSYWERRFGLLGLLGITIALSATAMAWINTVNEFFPSFAKPLFMARIEVTNVNRMLPAEIEPGVVLKAVVLNGTAMTHVYDVNLAFDATELAALGETLLLSNPDAQTVCHDMEGYFKGGLEYLAYSYNVQGRSVIAMMSAGDCLEFVKYGLSEPV